MLARQKRFKSVLFHRAYHWRSWTCRIAAPTNTVLTDWLIDAPLGLKFDQPLFEKRRHRRISTYNVSTVRDSEKVQPWRIGSRPRAFQRQRAIDVLKNRFCFFLFWIKCNFNQINVCYKISLCENFSEQGTTEHGPQTSDEFFCSTNWPILQVVQMQKASSFRAAMRYPLTPDQGFCPWTHAGALGTYFCTKF